MVTTKLCNFADKVQFIYSKSLQRNYNVSYVAGTVIRTGNSKIE